MAESKTWTCDRREEEAERCWNDEIRCHRHVPDVKNFSDSKCHFEIQYFWGLWNPLILLDFLRFAFFPVSQIFQNYRYKILIFPTLCRNTFLFCFISLNNFIFPTKLLGFIVFDDCTFLKCYNIFQCQKVCNLLMFLMI